jgi:DNA segregation ATPase FtsK/SpoIIIE-like protein
MKDSQSLLPDTSNISKTTQNENDGTADLLHEKSIEFIFNEGLKVVKVSAVQHHFRIGYNRAANILEKIRSLNKTSD